MTQGYPKPIAPPPEVIGEWWIAWDALDESGRPRLEDFIAARAAQWGADQELEACCEWLMHENDRQGLRAARRPKPPSLKVRLSKAIVEGDERQALKLLEELDD